MMNNIQIQLPFSRDLLASTRAQHLSVCFLIHEYRCEANIFVEADTETE